jgi:hypothetical protein
VEAYIITSDDYQPAEAREMVGALEREVITYRSVIQTLHVLQDIRCFRADLLLINIDIKEISGPQLARITVQYWE